MTRISPPTFLSSRLPAAALFNTIIALGTCIPSAFAGNIFAVNKQPTPILILPPPQAYGQPPPNFFAKNVQKELEIKPTEIAWNYIDGIGLGWWDKTQMQTNPTYKKDWEDQKQRIVTKCDQELKAQSGELSLKAFDAISEKMATVFARALIAVAKDRKPKVGDRFALAVGKLQIQSRGGYAPVATSQSKEELERQFSSWVSQKLSADDKVNEKYAIIAIDEDNATAIINKLGGGSDRWINEKGDNAPAIVVKDYHPDDIYVLTGTMVQFFESPHKISYSASCTVMHPRTRHQEMVQEPSFTVTFLYHPAFGWITEDVDQQLGKKDSSKSRK